MNAVTVAQALHWFDLDQFYTEVRRVSTPDGVLVISFYNGLAMAVFETSSVMTNQPREEPALEPPRSARN